jgi:DNA-directed RNA polymerase subunit K/omega
MKLEAISFSELAKRTGNNYKNAVIAAKRARYLISERAAARTPLEDIADEDYPFSEEVDALNEEYVEMDKPIVVAMEELITDQLEWSEGNPQEPSLFK